MVTKYSVCGYVTHIFILGMTWSCEFAFQDWSSGWRIKKKEMEEALQRKNEEIQQFMDDLQVKRKRFFFIRTV